MLIKASAALRNDYATISALAKETKEPIYITKNGEGDLVLMSIDAFEKRVMSGDGYLLKRHGAVVPGAERPAAMVPFCGGNRYRQNRVKRAEAASPIRWP